MISTQSMTSMLALSLIDREKETFLDGIRNDAQSKREIAAFKERIGGISNVKELQADFEVYSFVMKSFGLERQIPSKAMNEKIMTSDIEDEKSLVNRLTDAKFKELNEVMGFFKDGNASARLKNTEWVDGMVERYLGQRLIDDQTVTNPAVGAALTFQKQAPQMTNWYKVLGNKEVASFMRVALGLPENMATADIDAQARLFAKKMDIEDLQDPDVQKSLVRRYAAISDANNMNSASNPVLILFSPATNSGTWSATIDMGLAAGFRASQFR